MKLRAVVFLVIAVLFTGSYVVWDKWWYPKTYEYALKLADDSSLPEQKAAYLEEYIEKVKDISGPPRYIFTRPDLDVKKQTIILQGLVKRFKDIAKLDPKEMAYQQGMFQLTGQEIDHQLKRISGIFKSAKLRESLLMFYFFCVFPWIFWIVGVIFLLIWFDD